MDSTALRDHLGPWGKNKKIFSCIKRYAKFSYIVIFVLSLVPYQMVGISKLKKNFSASMLAESTDIKTFSQRSKCETQGSDISVPIWPGWLAGREEWL